MAGGITVNGETLSSGDIEYGDTILVQAGSESGIVGSEANGPDNEKPVITLTGDTETVLLQTPLTATVDDGSEIYYRIGEFGAWKKYTEAIIASLNETYYFMAADEAGNIGTNQITFKNIDTTGIMLSTLWAQRDLCPMGGNTTICYNEYTPYDPTVIPDTHSRVGCTNVADGQLIYYFIEKGGLDLTLTLEDSDEYTSSHKTEGGGRIVIEIKSDGSTPGTLSFAEINEYLSDYELDSAEHAAALSYACGVVNKSKYSADSTGTGIQNNSLFIRSGFKSMTIDGPFMGNYYWGYWDDDLNVHVSDAGYEVLIENLEAGRPVGANYPGHSLVIDGYDRETDTFHINFGWGYNQATRWYTREEMFEEQFNEFIYDLRVDYVETFTVTDARLYGTGTMIRAFEQAAGMVGANTVAFDPSVAGKTVELQNRIRIYDEVAADGFNMNVLVTSAVIIDSPAYGFYAYESDDTSALTFHASGGSLIVSTSNEYNHAFNMNKASSGTVTADHALIYAGRYSGGASAVLQSLKDSQSENTEVSEDLPDPNGWSFYGSAGNDVFSLSNFSIAVGNVSLDGGNDILSLTGHSGLYGTIDAGGGNDSITLDSTSSISGDLSGKSTLNFVLTELEDHALFTIKNSVSGLYSNATISADMTDAEIGTYTLFSAAPGAADIPDLQKLTVTVTGSGIPDFTLSVNGTPSADYAELIYDGKSLKLQIKAESGSIVLPQTQTWEKVGETAQYIVEYAMDAAFEHVIRIVAGTNSLDSFQMPAGNYQMRIKPAGGEWTALEPVAAEGADDKPKLVRSNADGNTDVFYVNTAGVWGSGCMAQHAGSVNDPWVGTREHVRLAGKNKLTDIFEGSADANILLMTDDGIGDALFVDDIYSDSPGKLGLSRSRIAQINEIRAGAGDDIVDMTSQRFEYSGDGLTIRGGDGNDIIWANRGENFLFVDSGNARLVGAAGNDVVAGGIGSDRMHGGGGSDIFTFCGNWGEDSVEQLAGGTVTLWFLTGSRDNWDSAALTYSDGENSVTVSGVGSDNIDLKFGAETDEDLFSALFGAGAFGEFSSGKIFDTEPEPKPAASSGFLA